MPQITHQPQQGKPWMASAFWFESAGASGVGSAAIQIAKDIGATVFVTSSSSEKLNFCKVTNMASELLYIAQL